MRIHTVVRESRLEGIMEFKGDEGLRSYMKMIMVLCVSLLDENRNEDLRITRMFPRELDRF